MAIRLLPCTSSSRNHCLFPCDSSLPSHLISSSRRRAWQLPFRASSQISDEPPSRNRSAPRELVENANKHIAKVALAAAVAGLILFNPTEDAMAARSGGRVGGQAFRSASPPPRAGPRINNSQRTNIFINPPTFVAPPLYGSPYFGGYGLSPFSFFIPGPSIAVGVGGGFNFFSFLLFMTLIGGIFNFFRRRNDDEDDYYD